MRSRGALLFLLAMAAVAGCGRLVASAPGDSPTALPTATGTPTGSPSATPRAAAGTPAASASATLAAPGIHVHTGPVGVETILGVRVLEVTPTVILGQWNQEQILVRSGPNTRFAEIQADGQVRFSAGGNFATAGLRPGDKLNLAIDWSDRATDGAYLVILATKL